MTNDPPSFNLFETSSIQFLQRHFLSSIIPRENEPRASHSMSQVLETLTECIAPQLSAVDALFRRELTSELACVNTLIKHVSRFRGKMLRPMLVLLAGKSCGSRELTDAHVTVATVVEMVHMATLVHDDVLDEAELRRKGATINHLRGNEAAVLLGDYMISHSYHLCSSLDSQFASRVIARTTNQVCEGELLQIDNRNNLDLSEETYLQIISLKTASSVRHMLPARRDAIESVAGTDQRAGNLLVRWLGIAFQMQDDILDIVGDAGTVGKTLGIDIEKQKMTLPVIHFSAPPPRPSISVLMRSPISSRDRGTRSSVSAT